MHKRNLARLLGDVIVAHCCISLFHVGPYDRVEEERRWCSRHRHRDSVPQVGGHEGS